MDGVRLVGGITPNVGRVEVSVNGEWGTVCSDFWDRSDAAVVCRQLGYPGYDSYEFAGEGVGQIWLDNVDCDGTEESIQDCPKNNIGIHNCGHHEDAGVQCTPVEPVDLTTPRGKFLI